MQMLKTRDYTQILTKLLITVMQYIELTEQDQRVCIFIDSIALLRDYTVTLKTGERITVEETLDQMLLQLSHRQYLN
jgi:hypothetical protein